MTKLYFYEDTEELCYGLKPTIGPLCGRGGGRAGHDARGEFQCAACLKYSSTLVRRSRIRRQWNSCAPGLGWPLRESLSESPSIMVM
jgi:hypothetical protein